MNFLELMSQAVDFDIFYRKDNENKKYTIIADHIRPLDDCNCVVDGGELWLHRQEVLDRDWVLLRGNMPHIRE